jgi:hypothetical protein
MGSAGQFDERCILKLSLVSEDVAVRVCGHCEVPLADVPPIRAHGTPARWSSEIRR